MPLLSGVKTLQICKPMMKEKATTTGVVRAGAVVRWVCPDHVNVGEQSTSIRQKGRAHAEDGSDQALVHEGVHSAVLHKAVKR